MFLDDQWYFKNNILNFSFQGSLTLFTIYLELLFWLNGEDNVDDDDNVTTILYSLELFSLTGTFWSLSHWSSPYSEIQEYMLICQIETLVTLFYNMICFYKILLMGNYYIFEWVLSYTDELRHYPRF